jgi:hypothetical protein
VKINVSITQGIHLGKRNTVDACCFYFLGAGGDIQLITRPSPKLELVMVGE